MDIDILTLEELQAATERADFADANQKLWATTMDFRPIDEILHHVQDFFAGLRREGFELPTLAFKGVRHVKAPHESRRAKLPESQWGPTQEDVAFDMSGVKVGDCLVLSIEGAAWALPAGAARLHAHRDMPFPVAAAFAGDAAQALISRMQARAIDQAAFPAKTGDGGGPRI